MAAKIRTRNNEPLEIFDKKRDINDYLIKDQPYNYLNKLKKLPNGALFYWNHALKLKKRYQVRKIIIVGAYGEIDEKVKGKNMFSHFFN